MADQTPGVPPCSGSSVGVSLRMLEDMRQETAPVKLRNKHGIYQEFGGIRAHFSYVCKAT